MLPTEVYIRQLRGPILVLGASGFIGANLYHMLAAHRTDVFAVVQREKSWRLADVPDDKVIANNLTDSSATKNLIDTIRPQTVFDCVAYGAYSFEEDAGKIYETNLQSLVNLVGLLSERPIAAFIHAGSSSEYGENSSAPAEDAICEPNSHYSVSKVAAEKFLCYMGKKRDFPVHICAFIPFMALSKIPRGLSQTY